MNGAVEMMRTLCAGLVVATVGAGPCKAIDYQPFDWVPLPPGTNVAMGYYEFGTRDEYNSTILGTLKNNTHLDSEIGIVRYLHYGDTMVFGNPWDFNVLVPFGALDNGEIAGQRLGNASGVGDPVITAGYWLINQPGSRRWLSAADYVTIPIGTYNRGRPLNLGGNRWQNDFQVDFTQGLSDKLTLDVSADWIYYGDNTEAGNGFQRLSQNATFGAYAWLAYDISDLVRKMFPNSSHANMAIGYAGTFGGDQKLDGVDTGARTVEHQVRLTYMMFFTPSWQGLLSVNHDVAVSGQFKQEFGLVLRLSKLF